MQHPSTVPPVTNTFPTAPLTTDQIQKLLDENKQLIMMILENESLGKLAECAQYQAVLQKNLMYLAAIADAQPQAVLSQTPMQPVLQQGNLIPQQSNTMVSKIPHQVHSQMQLIHPQLQYQQQQQQLFQGHVGIRPGTQAHQSSPGVLLDSNSFGDALGGRHDFSITPGSGNMQGNQFGSDKQS